MMGLRDCKQFNGGAKTLQTKFIVFLVARQYDFCWIVWMEITAVFYWRLSWSVYGKCYDSFLTLCMVVLGVKGLLAVII